MADIEFTDDGGAMVGIDEDESVVREDPDFEENLAEFLDGDLLDKIGLEVVEGFMADKESRSGWESMLAAGLKLLGVRFEESGGLFDGACLAVHPQIIESAVKFQSKASQELFPPGGPVRTQIIGAETPDKIKKAARVRDHMNWQLTEQQTEYFDDHERLLFKLALDGSAFKKSYYDPAIGRNISEYVPVEDVFVAYGASDLDRAERVTHRMTLTPRILTSRQMSGQYLDIDIGSPTTDERSEIREKIDELNKMEPDSKREVYTVLEQSTFLDLTGPNEDPMAVEPGRMYPYIVTVDQHSGKVLAVRRNWVDEDNLIRLRWFTHYKFVPSDGFYGYGLIHLLGNWTMASTILMRGIVDASTFANLQAGFKAKGIKIVGDENQPLAPGEWRDVEAHGTDLAKSLIPLPFKGPTPTSFEALKFLDQRGQQFADTTESTIQSSQNVGPVGTTLALLEASGKMFAAVFKRLHNSQRDEFRILKFLNKWYLPDEYPYDVEGGDRKVLRSDYDDAINILPVSDPNVPSSAQRLVKAQALFSTAVQAPQLHDMHEAIRRVYEAMDVKDIEKVLPTPQDATPSDPVTDIISAVQGKPIKAFPGQDHDAHIQVKTAWTQDPMNGGAPLMQVASNAIKSNIRDHQMLKWTEQMQGLSAMQMPLQEAAQKILVANQMAAAQMGQSGNIEMANIELRERELDIREMEMQSDEVREAAALALKDKELDIRAKTDNMKIETDRMKVAVQVKDAKEKLALQARDGKETRNQQAVQMLVNAAAEDARMAHDAVQKDKDRKAKPQTKVK